LQNTCDSDPKLYTVEKVEDCLPMRLNWCNLKYLHAQAARLLSTGYKLRVAFLQSFESNHSQ